MGFRYHFGGVALEADRQFTGLRVLAAPEAEAPRIRLTSEAGDVPAEEKLLFAWNGRFRMRLGQLGADWLLGSPWGCFLFDKNADHVRMFGGDGPDGGVLKDLFVRRVLPRLVKLKGAATYHAASLAKNGHGILVMGRSGAGKSTMSVGLAATQGWDILGDDMALIWNHGAEEIAPAATDVTIWPQSCAGLGLSDQDCLPLVAYEGKKAYQPPRVATAERRPVKGIFFLDRQDCDRPVLHRRSRHEAFALALGQLIFFNPSGGAASKERIDSVMRLNDLLGRTPAWSLAYPASYDRFGAISETILAAIEHEGTRALIQHASGRQAR